MAFLGDVFTNLKGFLKKLGGSLKPHPQAASVAHLQETLRQFLFGFQWLGNSGQHHRRAMYNADREQLYVEFKSGEIYTIEEVGIGAATTYWAAPRKGIWYWDHVRVRGKGNAGKTQKPYHKGLG